MKPKICFILKSVALISGVFLLFLFIIYLISFIFFSLRLSGAWFLPRFGFLGIKILFGSLPWLLVLAAAILIIVLEMSAKHFTFVYRRPAVYSLLGVIAIVLTIGFFVNKTPLHPNLFLRARDNHLPAIGPLYRNFGSPRIPNVHFGIVSEITDNGFLIKTPHGETITVIIPPEILPLETEVKKGDAVVVIGEREGDTVRAFDIKEAERDFDFSPIPPPFQEEQPFRR